MLSRSHTGAERAATNISAVVRTMDLMEALAAEPAGLTVSEIAERLEISVSLASRMLTSLEGAGYVYRARRHDEYKLTSKLVVLTQRYAHRMQLPQLCQPVLQALAAETGELVQLAVANGDELQILTAAQGDQLVRLSRQIGHKIIPHATATGKAWLAALPEAEALRIALKHGLTPFTSWSIVAIDDFLADLRETDARGYSLALSEYTEHANAIGIAVRVGPNRVPVGAVNVAGPAYRLTAERIGEISEKLVAAAQQLGEIWPWDALTGPDDLANPDDRPVTARHSASNNAARGVE